MSSSRSNNRAALPESWQASIRYLVSGLSLSLMLFGAGTSKGACFAATINDTSSTLLEKPTSLRGPLAMEPGVLDLKLKATRGVCCFESGTRFPVVLLTELSSESCKSGHEVKAMLAEDLTAGELLLAPKGSMLKGWVSGIRKPRCALAMKVPNDQFMKGNGGIQIYLDTLTLPDGTSIPIRAGLAPHGAVRGVPSLDPVEIDRSGSISLNYHTIHYTGVTVGVTATSIAARSLGFFIGPAISGGTALIDPGYAYGKPLHDPSTWKRTKAFGRGLLKGLPGAFLYFGLEEKGDHIVLPAGAELPIQLTADLLLTDERVASKQGGAVSM